MTAHVILSPRTVRSTVAAILGTSMMYALVSPVAAQEEPSAQKAGEVQEVTVTGSRIVRKDFEATSPIVTVGTEAFEQTSKIAIEASLNKLPQFTPAVTQQVTQDVQNTATNTVGASTVSLRGLGPNRNLVLVDGRRAMPVNAQMVVDVNSIPSAAVERVEIITGGASSVYGADAVGGVVNFILKKDFQGIQFDTQYGATELHDGEEFRVSGLVGGNFADGRGNIMFGAEHYKREGAAMLDRDFYVNRLRQPNINGTEFFYSDTYFTPAATNQPSQAAINGIFTQAATPVTRGSLFFVNNDGTVYTGAAAGSSVSGAYRYNGPLDGLFRKIQANGQIGQNQLDNLVSTPLTRYSLFGRGRFDLTDHATFFVEGNFNTNHVDTILQFSPAVNGWAVTIPHGTGIYAPSVDANGNTLAAYQTGGSLGLNCPATGGCTNSQAFPVPTELGALLDSRATPNSPWQLNKVLDFLGPRGSSNDSLNYQVSAGFNGSFPNNDWTWEAYVSHGETTVSIELSGFGSLSRYRSIVSSANYGRNFFVTANSGAPGAGFAGAVVSCTSGMPIFGGGTPSEDCIDAVNANLQNHTKMVQNIVEANLQGKAFNMPAGELRFALGATHRENDFKYQTDILTSQQSFLDGGIGLFPAGDSTGSTKVNEVYGELLVPVLSDIPAIRQMNLELGYRHSDYDTVGKVSTYKGILDWSLTSSLRFRGGYQRAIRAPNIGELFLARTQTVGATAFGDPCSLLALAPFGANPTLNPAHAADARRVCESIMGGPGATAFYSAAPIQATGGLALPNTIGNPLLDPETAKTYTAGLVFSSPFDGRFSKRLRASVDYYSIQIEDAIGATSVDTVAQQCLDATFNPNFDPTVAACQAIVRDPNTGGQGTINTSYTNAGFIKTAGVDLQLDYGLDMADFGAAAIGNFSLNFLFNWVDKYQTRAAPGAALIEWKDSLGPTTPPGLNPGVYRYKAFTTLNWYKGVAGASLRWRHLPSVRAAAAAQAASTPGAPASPVIGASSYSIFDLSGTWSVTDALQLRFGVDNLLDKDQPVINFNPTVVQGGGVLDANAGGGPGGNYDALGRTYYLGVRAQF